MKFGILTLHDSVNYGALAQAFALRRHLMACGHDAVLIDRRRQAADIDIRTPGLDRPYARFLGIFRCNAHNGMREAELRIERTRRFLRSEAGLSAYSFHDWRHAPANLGVDAVIVGSDQVWNANNLDPEDYLLRDLPGAVPGIAYAASIGMPELPADRLDAYRRGFARFRKISVREREAAELVRAQGFAAEQVVDPVLLAGRRAWDGIVDGRSGGSGRTFAYFLAEDFGSLSAPLAEFSGRTGSRVDFFTDWFSLGRVRRFRQARANAKRLRAIAGSGIDLRLDAGPVEFVRAVAAADRVVSNSYHALMFALVFGKEVRIVLPTNPVRRAMNSRLEEFAAVIEGPFLHDSPGSALSSFVRGERCRVNVTELARRITASREWLDGAIRELGDRP